MDFRDWLLIILAIFIPPIPVIIKKGCTGSVFVNLLLCLLAWIFGVVHAVYVIASTPYVNPDVVAVAPPHHESYSDHSYKSGSYSSGHPHPGYNNLQGPQPEYNPPHPGYNPPQGPQPGYNPPQPSSNLHPAVNPPHDPPGYNSPPKQEHGYYESVESKEGKSV